MPDPDPAETDETPLVDQSDPEPTMDEEDLDAVLRRRLHERQERVRRRINDILTEERFTLHAEPRIEGGRIIAEVLCMPIEQYRALGLGS